MLLVVLVVVALEEKVVVTDVVGVEVAVVGVVD